MMRCFFLMRLMASCGGGPKVMNRHVGRLVPSALSLSPGPSAFFLCIFASGFLEHLMKRILITGASGFLGSFVVQEALDRGLDTWAGVRGSSSRGYLQDERIRFISLDYRGVDTLCAQLQEDASRNGRFDVIVHCAGVTKCVDPADFDRVNYLQTRTFVEALIKCGLVPDSFVYISTLSVFGPVREKDYTEIQDTDPMAPNTAYAKSKQKAEDFLKSQKDFPFVILRPTGIYGPREKDYFLMAKSIMSHMDFSVGFKRQDITFVYVKDVVQAIFKAVDKGVRGKAYFLSDGKVYQSKTFSNLLIRELNQKMVLRVRCPLCILYLVSLIMEGWSRLTGRSSTLNTDKYHIMSQRNWRCDITPAKRDLDYAPEYPLDRGVKETVAWYRKEGWL